MIIEERKGTDIISLPLITLWMGDLDVFYEVDKVLHLDVCKSSNKYINWKYQTYKIPWFHGEKTIKLFANN